MSGYIEGTDRGQMTLFPDRLEDWIGEDNPVRVVDLFVDEIDLAELGFGRVAPASTGRPGYHPSVLLKLFIYPTISVARIAAIRLDIGGAYHAAVLS
jgi:transposase